DRDARGGRGGEAGKEQRRGLPESAPERPSDDQRGAEDTAAPPARNGERRREDLHAGEQQQEGNRVPAVDGLLDVAIAHPQRLWDDEGDPAEEERSEGGLRTGRQGDRTEESIELSVEDPWVVG